MKPIGVVVIAAMLLLGACSEADEQGTGREPNGGHSAVEEVPASTAAEFCELIAGTRHELDPYKPWLNNVCMPLMTTGAGANLTFVEQNMVASCLIDNPAASAESCIEETTVQRYADDLPDCLETWAGGFLPEDYKGCVRADGTLDPARTGECPDGRTHVVFYDDDKTYVAFTDDWVIHDADAAGNGFLCSVGSAHTKVG